MKVVLRWLVAVLALLLLAAAQTARAQEAPKTETVQFPGSNKTTVNGFVASPAKPGRYPSIIVIHDWWGLNDFVKQQTEKLAGEGFVALAVDLYGGKVTSDPAEAHEWSRSLNTDQAVLNLMESIVYLSSRNDVERGRVGVLGWSMGGWYALQLAIRVPRLGACVVNYGVLPTDPNDMQNIGAPVLGNFGADDHGVTPADVQAFQKAMQTLDRQVDVKIYDGAGHSFEDPDNKTAYRPEAAEDAWKRTIAFLNKSLR
ncbi:MAG TPA: dienelactone hydrolase family protein [Candidatus Acidoferrum sp.]|nr:dienelactone hydrolase family protein [Candidatus Acidoferrum sp.]